MSESPPNNDDLHGSLNDALTDRLLAEAIGGESPPDLRDAILDHAADSKATLTTEPKMQSSQFRFGIMSLAACLLICASLAALMLPATQSEREIARVVDSQTSERNASEYRSASQPIEKYKEKKEAVGVSVPLSEPTVDIPTSVVEESAPRVALEFSFPVTDESTSDAVATVTVAGDDIASLGRQSGRESKFKAIAQPNEGNFRSKVETERQWFTPVPIDAVAAVPSTPQSGYFFRNNFGRSQQSTFGYHINDARVLHGHPGHLTERTRGDQYAAINENKFIIAQGGNAVSTFSIDVDTASYANVRQFLTQSHQLPPANAVRIEELINYFNYDYEGPEADSETPFAAAMEVAACPWAPQHRLVRIGIKGREIKTEKRPLSNLVFLVDVSGSMSQPNKLPLLVNGLKRLTRQLGENDRVAIVVYASSEGLALPSTPGSERSTILTALDRLAAGGSTAGGAGIQLAYEVAQENLIEGGVNRILLCTDGDFNVGLSDRNALGDLVEHKAKETGVFLSVLGFGRGNLNDAMMETISNRGNGNYAYIDNDREAHRVLVTQMSGTLITIAKDVKIQVEFNPAHVASYRLIGYENRMLKTEDFNNDAKDAGEIGAGHTVTALYEIVPKGVALPAGADPLKYQQADTVEPVAEVDEADTLGTGLSDSDEMLTLKIRYKQPDGDVSTKLEFPLVDEGHSFDSASGDFKFATAVASFGMLLRHSEHAGEATYATVLELAEEGIGTDQQGDRSEFIGLVRQAQTFHGE